MVGHFWCFLASKNFAEKIPAGFGLFSLFLGPSQVPARQPGSDYPPGPPPLWGGQRKNAGHFSSFVQLDPLGGPKKFPVLFT